MLSNQIRAGQGLDLDPAWNLTWTRRDTLGDDAVGSSYRRWASKAVKTFPLNFWNLVNSQATTMYDASPNRREDQLPPAASCEEERRRGGRGGEREEQEGRGAGVGERGINCTCTVIEEERRRGKRRGEERRGREEERGEM
ncbi:hypothetical protein WMY93_033238 [Mugilogobius chulae]|uniref:Uncharacterized protein n=1 Tax=Mugilogobius chulae TaxID=88201 RepID=A0AAW0ML89_9GOBI